MRLYIYMCTIIKSTLWIIQFIFFKVIIFSVYFIYTCIRNLQVSLVGLTALMALLHHSHFYQEMLVVFTNFYAQPTIQQISATELMISPHMSSVSSESTMSTSGKPNYVKMRDWKLKFIKRIYDGLMCWTIYGQCELKSS